MPIPDTTYQDSTVIITLQPNAAYSLALTASSATVTIRDPEPLPIVSVTAPAPLASVLGSDPGLFTISRTVNLLHDLTVTIQLSGTATNGVDYQMFCT